MMRSIERNAIFLVGAGASLGSKLPNGAMLAKRTFNLLVNSDAIISDAAALAKIRAALSYDLRLETFLEILAGEVGAEIAFKPFASLRWGEPCFAHFAILTLSKNIVVTTNQDVLFERAAVRAGATTRILHLHGRCDRIGTIITVVSQYLGGLNNRVRTPFERATRGREVVVFGYSGRDRDVMPVLVEAKPNCITWILHKGSTVSPELEVARLRLGDRLQILSVDSDHWLAAQLTRAERIHVRNQIGPIIRHSLSLPRSWFESITSLQRNRAIAKTFEHIGEYNEAYTIYKELNRLQPRRDGQLKLDLATVAARVKGHEAARRIYRSIAKRSRLAPEVSANLLLEEADALRNLSKPAQAMRVLGALDGLLQKKKNEFTPKSYWRLRGWSQIAQAGIDRIEGRLTTAQQVYARAQRDFSRARDIDGRIDSLTWQSETALIAGDYLAAGLLADAAIADAVAYAKGLVKAWPWYVKAEGLLLAGQGAEALLLARVAEKAFRVRGNIQGTFWSRILRIDCFKDRSWAAARKLLNSVRDGLGTLPLAHVRARLLLEQADLARACRDWDEVHEALKELSSHLRGKGFTRPPRLIEAHAALVAAECARDCGFENAPQQLRSVRDRYAKLHANSMATRAEAALTLALGPRAPRKHLRAYCLAREYNREVLALDGRIGAYYPIQFV